MKAFALVPLALFSLAASKGVYRIKLEKEPVPSALLNPNAAIASLSRKYNVIQTPPNSADSAPVREEGYFYTQDQEVLGGHNLPLTSWFFCYY